MRGEDIVSGKRREDQKVTWKRGSGQACTSRRGKRRTNIGSAESDGGENRRKKASLVGGKLYQRKNVFGA